LTLRDLLESDAQRLARLQLVVLSACQTAVTDVQELPNEAIGLFSGFLHTGVPAVIGTLWSVDEVSTALLMTRFYDLYLHGDPQEELLPHQPLTALRLAQRWLRNLSNNALYEYLNEQVRLKRPSISTPALRSKLRTEIRAGKERREMCPYGHAYHWAAFVYYGAW
jgi:CHAT domain-containing protein